MRKVKYGSKTIQYSVLEKQGLKSHYISVEKQSGVILKGKPVPETIADTLILKKAKWILNKLDVVASDDDQEIVTGTRIPYLGKNYYVQIIVDPTIKKVMVSFNYSKFIIKIQSHKTPQDQIKTALQQFFQKKAIEKITPRVSKLSQKTRLPFRGLQFRKMNKRWGSCTGKNILILNTEAIKLPFSLIDYLIVHELVHTKVKDHSKSYWAELSKHVRNWKALDERMREMKM